MTITERIESNVERIPESGCWLWTKSLRGNGYGQFTHPDRKQEGAHRVAYRAYRGPIPDGMMVCHRCDVPSCCNPDHLFLGTAKDNAVDMVRKGRANPGRVGCVGERRKVQEWERKDVAARYACGMLQREIAALYGISQVRVSQIVRRYRDNH